MNLCVLYGPQQKQLQFPYTVLTDQFLQWSSMFTEL